MPCATIPPNADDCEILALLRGVAYGMPNRVISQRNSPVSIAGPDVVTGVVLASPPTTILSGSESFTNLGCCDTTVRIDFAPVMEIDMYQNSLAVLEPDADAYLYLRADIGAAPSTIIGVHHAGKDAAVPPSPSGSVRQEAVAQWVHPIFTPILAGATITVNWDIQRFVSLGRVRNYDVWRPVITFDTTICV